MTELDVGLIFGEAHGLSLRKKYFAHNNDRRLYLSFANFGCSPIPLFYYR
jgi:hypothetical protein